jgi:hypothetical protein
MAMFIHKIAHYKFVISTVLAGVVGIGLYGCLSNQAVPINAAETPLPGTGIAIYVAGDIADCRKFKPSDSGAAKTASLILAGLDKDKDAAVLSLGDNTYPAGLLAEFTDCYEPTWGRFKQRTYPTPGNHEYYTPEAVGYYDYFGSAAGPARRGYFSFDLGKWHIVSINSNLKAPDHQQQLAWLKTDLAQHPARCTLAYWHHPLYSSGGHGNNDRMRDVWQVLKAADAEMVLVGHDHDYERFAPQDAEGQRDDAHGIREFVVGTGGAKLTPFVLRKANSEVSNNSTHGVLRMVLKDTGYEWEFLPVAGGGFTDRGSALCH